MGRTDIIPTISKLLQATELGEYFSKVLPDSNTPPEMFLTVASQSGYFCLFQTSSTWPVQNSLGVIPKRIQLKSDSVFPAQYTLLGHQDRHTAPVHL